MSQSITTEARPPARDIPAPAQGATKTRRDPIEALLRRYPHNDAETAEIRHFLATGSHLDVGLVAGSDEFKETVQRFRKEHAPYFRLKLREVAMFLLATAGPVGALFWRYLG